jgi:hypothetical protein
LVATTLFWSQQEWHGVAQSGNGVDIGTIYQLLLQMSARLNSHDRKLDQLLEIVNEHSRTFVDHTHQFNDLNAAVAGLRSAVGDYHETVVGHGIHCSELDGRVHRIEQYLKLDPAGE